MPIGTSAPTSQPGGVRRARSPRIRQRSDGVNLPEVHGIIRTDDHAFLLFRMQGRTPPATDGKRRLLGFEFFEAEDKRYAWLNSALCVLEAVLRSGGSTHARISQCVPELE